MIVTRDAGRKVVVYEVGDHVRLLRSEAGAISTASRTEWGRVVRAEEGPGGQRLDILLAGFSRPKGAPLERVRQFPAHAVLATDERGIALPEEAFETVVTRRPAGRVARARPVAPQGRGGGGRVAAWLGAAVALAGAALVVLR